MTNVAVHLEGQPLLQTHVHDAAQLEHARKGAAASDQALSRDLGMVVRPQHLLLSCRLLWLAWLSQVVADPAVHDVEGWPDCRRLHALAWERLALAYAILLPPVLVLVFVAIMVFESDYTHSHPGHIVRVTDVGIITSYRSASHQKEGGYDHIHHARKLDRPGRAESKGLATSSGREKASSQRYERRVQARFSHLGRL